MRVVEDPSCDVLAKADFADVVLLLEPIQLFGRELGADHDPRVGKVHQGPPMKI